MQPDREYRGLVASSWDLLRGDTSQWPDRSFYREVIQRFGEPALDVGCANGRLLLDYASLGVDIDGVDASPEMLSMCWTKALRLGLKPRLFEQRVEALELPRRYKTILVPSSSFQLVIEKEEARAVMARLRNHLAPAGVLVMSFMELWREGEPLRQDWRLDAEAVRSSDGATIRRFDRSQFHPDRSVAASESRYEVVVDGSVRETELHLSQVRSYTQEQAAQLYWEAGLEDVQILRAFTWQPAIARNRLFCVLGCRPS